jgi:hypothetical protein
MWPEYNQAIVLQGRLWTSTVRHAVARDSFVGQVTSGGHDYVLLLVPVSCVSTGGHGRQ